MVSKKKRGHPDIDEILNRPWCYYCERDFDDLKILINHQKAKHYKCERCGRRLNTAGGLAIHMNQVHKETLLQVDNALPNRSGLDYEVFGMEGIPEDVAAIHRQRVLTQYAQSEADRRAASGNNPAGGAAGNASKKPKFESPSDLKKRLAEHKAKIAAEQAAASTADTASPENLPAQAASSFAQSQPYMPYGQPVSGPPASGGFESYPPNPYNHQLPPFPQSQPPFGATPSAPFTSSHMSPPPPFQVDDSPYAPPSQYQTGTTGPSFARDNANNQNSGGGLPTSFPAAMSSPGTSLNQHSDNLPSISPMPLPQRPAFAPPPPVNGADSGSAAPSSAPHDLPAPVEAEVKAGGDKKSKKEKDKDKGTKMIYSDDKISPEEKMARMPQYVFDSKIREEANLAADLAPPIAGPVGGLDEMIDPAR